MKIFATLLIVFTILPLYAFTLGNTETTEIFLSNGVTVDYHNTDNCSASTKDKCNQYVIGGINQKGNLGYATTSKLTDYLKKELGRGHTASDLGLTPTDAGKTTISGWSTF